MHGNVDDQADGETDQGRTRRVRRVEVEVEEEPETAPRLYGEQVSKVLLHGVEQKQPFCHF